MLQLIRRTFINQLWQKHCARSMQMQIITSALKEKYHSAIHLDHFAVIDLPSASTGIPILNKIFSMLGFSLRGRDYLPEKQNDFNWLAENTSEHTNAVDTLPQVVTADFRLDELPSEIRKIIAHYANQANAFSFQAFQQLIEKSLDQDQVALRALLAMLSHYFNGRDWPLPTQKEFYTVAEFNELLAWVLVLGRLPNHFTLSIHLLPCFKNLTHFHYFIEDELGLPLHHEGGKIKGGEKMGLAQSSTIGTPETIQLADGAIPLAVSFVEFVWRYPKIRHSSGTPLKWDDYFTGFIAGQATHVIESLYA